MLLNASERPDGIPFRIHGASDKRQGIYVAGDYDYITVSGRTIAGGGVTGGILTALHPPAALELK